ncbi:hypothetical protein L0Y40_00765 [Candidatus Wolfebacteria bacterium]|nr:hypothetical protein [Candidatus Wolfebacteria bacterium]
MTWNTQKGNTRILLIFLAVLLVIGGGALSFANWRDANVPRTSDGEGAEVPTGWQEYRNDEYGFAFDYPDDWTVAAFPDNQIAPMFNVYPSGTAGEPPFIHHNNVTQVSVFPYGVPTEGVFGKTASGDGSLVPDAGEVRDFLLADGTVWAKMAVGFPRAPSNWNEAGFLWASVVVENLATECRRNGEVITEAECDPFLGDTLIQSGIVNAEERNIAEQILASFRFLELSGGTSAQGVNQLIRVDEPEPNHVIISPLSIRGEARGTWYFEATFPVVLVDWDGRIIAEGYAEAQDEWMTEEFVPFTAMLTFTKPFYGERGALILKKDNPSGLPEHDAALEIPIRFE